jgi:hypothetical protein
MKALSLAAIALVSALFALTAHADTYNVLGPWFENQWGFQSLDQYGDLYLVNRDSSNPEYWTLLPNGSSITSSVAPNFIPDDGSRCLESFAGFSYTNDAICNGDLVAFLYAADGGPDTSLYVYYGTGTPQLVLPAPSGDLLAMNSLGDIVFDNGFWDNGYYAVDLATLPGPTPEPSTLLLLTTGILTLAAVTALRRRPIPQP